MARLFVDDVADDVVYFFLRPLLIEDIISFFCGRKLIDDDLKRFIRQLIQIASSFDQSALISYFVIGLFFSGKTEVPLHFHIHNFNLLLHSLFAVP